MKSEDFERLKAKLGDEFNVRLGDSDTDISIIYVNKKDIWEGVEFVEFYNPIKDNSFTTGKVYKVDRITYNRVNILFDNSGKSNGWLKEYFKPSTESSYIEQLKKEAFERFGDIKEGDRFDRSLLGYVDGEIHFIPAAGYEKGYSYNKDDDRLYFDNLVIYKQGKWATKVKERIKVKNWSYRTEEKGGKIYHECVFIAPIKEFDDDVHIFLASQLEAYLNGEIE